eukprot:553825_1
MPWTTKNAKAANAIRTQRSHAKRDAKKRASKLGKEARETNQQEAKNDEEKQIIDDISESCPSILSLPTSPIMTRSATKIKRKKKITTSFQGTSVISNEKYKELTDYIIDNPKYCDKLNCNGERARMTSRSAWGGV